MAPLANQIHVDTLLSNVSIKYRNPEFIATSVFPEVAVKKTSDLYRVYDRNFRIPETKRANRGVAREHEFEVSTASYSLEKHALKSYVSDQDADNYDLADLRAETTEELTDVILRRLEKSVADIFVKSSWSLNVSLASTNQFDDNTTVSNPIPVFDTGATTVIQNSGVTPNYGILPRDGFIACKSHVSILDRTKYTSADMDVQILQGLFGLEELLVPVAAYDTSGLGQPIASQSITPMFADFAFLGYKPSAPGPLKASAGYTFKKNVPMVKRWRVEEREADAIEVNMEYAVKVVASLAGYFIGDTMN